MHEAYVTDLSSSGIMMQGLVESTSGHERLPLVRLQAAGNGEVIQSLQLVPMLLSQHSSAVVHHVLLLHAGQIQLAEVRVQLVGTLLLAAVLGSLGHLHHTTHTLSSCCASPMPGGEHVLDRNLTASYIMVE